VLNRQQISGLLKSRSVPGPWLLIAKEIAPAICASLKALKIGFIDCHGPHQTAKLSIITGFFEFKTSSLKFEELISLTVIFC